MVLSLDLLEHLDLLIGLERHDGLFPVPAPAGVPALSLDLASHLQCLNAGDFHAEDAFDRAADLELVGIARHFEEVLVACLAQGGPLLGDERLPDDRAGILHDAKTSFMRSRPAWVSKRASHSNRS